MSDDFPKNQWPTLRDAMASGGPDAVIAFVAGHDDLQRRQLYLYAVGAFSSEPWDRDFDAYLQVAEAGIDECLAQAAAEADPEIAAKRTDLANILAYNAGAALCDCWEERGPRERRHFEAGLALAERCLAWRDELGKGPWPRSMAWWLKGMHLLSLGRSPEAAAAFEAAVGFAREHGGAETFGVVLSEGYRGIAESCAGSPGGADRYAAACAAFERMATVDDQREDAEFGLAQLRTVRDRYC